MLNAPSSLVQVLRELVRRPSPVAEEAVVRAWVKGYLSGRVDHLWEDQKGNLHLLRGEPPWVMLCAHLDTAQTQQDTERLREAPEEYYDVSDVAIMGVDATSIGADDKAGLGIVCWLLRETNLPCYALLTVEEEFEQRGARALTEECFASVSICLTLDLPGCGAYAVPDGCYHSPPDDVVSFVANLHLDEQPLRPLTQNLRRGDSFWISRHVPAIDLSCGFHCSHTDGDFIHLPSCYFMARYTRNVVEGLLLMRG